MYHINNEGKIYPCRAKKRPCPYGQKNHAKTKEELYHKILKEDYDNVPIPQSVKNEIAITGRLKSLMRLSDEIETKPHPIESIIQSLNYAIKAQETEDINGLKQKYANYYTGLYKETYSAIKRGLRDDLPHWIPKEIKEKAYKESRDAVDGDLIYERLSDEDVLKKVYAYKELTEDYEEYKRYRLTEEIYEDNMRWLKEDFYQFSHDFNTSKMLVQPVFAGNTKEARETISKLNDEELLSAYDDYLISEDEITENIRLANGFNYTEREDLSPKANSKIKEWYNMNRILAQRWEKDKVRRTIINLELSKELIRRNLSHQERQRK